MSPCRCGQAHLATLRAASRSLSSEQNTARRSADTASARAWHEQAAARRHAAWAATPREQARQRVRRQAAVARAQLPVAQRVLPACAPPRAASEANAGSLKQRR